MARMPARPASRTRKQAPTIKKAPGRKQAASKSTSKKAPRKEAFGKQAVAKKTKPGKKATAKKVTAKKVTAKKVTAKKVTAKKVTAKKVTAKKAAAPTTVPKATPARDAVQALAAKRAISQALTPLHNDRSAVEAYLREIDHPFKAEMEAVRAIILGVSDKISERIKWNAPSFFYKEDLGAFNPRATEYAHLILLFPGGAGMDDKSGLLEGNHKDRREAKFHSLDDVKAKKRALEKLVKNWILLRDG
jgi:hypothetical protein